MLRAIRYVLLLVTTFIQEEPRLKTVNIASIFAFGIV